MCQKPKVQNKTQYGTIYTKFKNLPKRKVGWIWILSFISKNTKPRQRT